MSQVKDNCVSSATTSSSSPLSPLIEDTQNNPESLIFYHNVCLIVINIYIHLITMYNLKITQLMQLLNI